MLQIINIKDFVCIINRCSASFISLRNIFRTLSAYQSCSFGPRDTQHSEGADKGVDVKTYIQPRSIPIKT